MATSFELAASKVRGVVARDTGRSLDALLNTARYPLALAALCVSESGLDEHSERYQPNCDKSAGLVHRSVCYVPDAIAQRIPGFYLDKDADGRYAASLTNYKALRAYYWSAENALDDARPRIDALMDQYRDPVEAVCRWNKPSIPGPQNPNYAHIVASWDAVQKYQAEEDPMSTDTFEVSPEMRQHMADKQDAPLGDETYWVNTPKVKASMCPGTQGLYVYHSQANKVYVVDPK